MQQIETRASIHSASPRPQLRSAALEPDQLAEIARAVWREEAYWRPLVRHDPSRRWFLRLRGTARVEAWLLSWTREQGVALHDHGGAGGAVLVVDGELTEEFSDLDSLAAPRQKSWASGTLHCFGPRHVHDLRNRGDEPALSIHVYSPPLSSMTFYRRDANGLLAPDRTEVVSGDDALLAAAL